MRWKKLLLVLSNIVDMIYAITKMIYSCEIIRSVIELEDSSKGKIVIAW